MALHITERLHYLLELLAKDQLTTEQFGLELDRLDLHLQRSQDAWDQLDFTSDYQRGPALLDSYHQSLEFLYDALEGMREFADTLELERAEQALALSQRGENQLKRLASELQRELGS